MRDSISISFSKEEQLVITSDNSGSIGMKEQDSVKVPYETVSYFSFRAAVMELIASKAAPISVVIQNFCGEDAWEKLTAGVQKGLSELGLEGVPITGSTESNFSLLQSVIGITVLGKKRMFNEESAGNRNIALIGLPLVGDEVVHESEAIASLSLFKEISEFKDSLVWPVGSKGVLHELGRMFPDLDKDKIIPSSEIDFRKSGGPSTSFITVYPPRLEESMMNIAGKHFRKIMEGTTY